MLISSEGKERKRQRWKERGKEGKRETSVLFIFFFLKKEEDDRGPLRVK